jgi:hypothetical protein
MSATPLETTMKLCKDCQHFVPAQWVGFDVHPSRCWHPNNRSVVDESLLETPHALRYHSYGKCGQIGLWWRPKNEPAP